MNIIDYFKSRGIAVPDEENYTDIRSWLSWYRGFVEDFHKYSVYNGTNMVSVQLFSLGMAKTCCEDHANLLLNEKVQINAEFAALPDILRANSFRTRANQLIEIAFALGTGAFVEYISPAGPIIDYIRGDMIYPITWDNGSITECAFASVKKLEEKKVYYIQEHRCSGGAYIIINRYVDEDGTELPLPEGIAPEVDTKSPAPLFQIVKPNIVNNLRLDSPMGISVFGNAIDQIKAMDLTYDSYVNEFKLGRKRIMVPMSMAKIQAQTDGIMQPSFDPRDTVFYVFENAQDGKNDIKEINMSIRSTEHDLGLQRALDIFSKKVGLGSGYYRFQDGAVKTATEVISAQSELYKNRNKNGILLEAALVGMTRALSFLCGGSADIDVSVALDDSIIDDTQTKIQNNILLVTNDLRSHEAAIADIDGVDDAEAARRYTAIKAEKGGNADTVMQFDKMGV